MPNKIFETKYANYWKEEGILHVVFAPNLVVSLEEAKTMIEERHTFTKGITMPTCVDIRGLASIDTPARKYFACERALEGISAAALVADSLISKLAGNLYITVDKPLRPLKLFTDRDKALKWLRGYIV